MSKGKILIVDDDPDICESLKDILEMEGYEAHMALDGYAALKAAGETRFDVVLMDVRMPGIDGVETFRRFKKVQPGTPVIMITAYAMEDMLKQALKEGAFATLNKPLDFKLLFNTIERAKPNGGLVLVVDDDRDTCDVIRDALAEKGFRVETAHDGRNAVRISRTADFSVVILDMKLPVMNGLEVFLEIREVRPNAVVILLTGFPAEMNQQVKDALEKGAYICLNKPIDPRELISILEKLVRR